MSVEAVVGGDRLGEFEHLVETATRLDRPAHRQRVITLEPQLTGEFGSEEPVESLLRRGGPHERRFDQSAAGLGEGRCEFDGDRCRFREGLGEPRGEAVEPGRRGIHDVGEIGQGRLGGGSPDPCGRLG